MFVIGDILLKVDDRRYFSAYFTTRHHAMLVIGVTTNGYPIVAHMKFTNFARKTGRLVIEACTKGRDLILLHCSSFSEKLRETIFDTVQQAYNHNKLHISQSLLETRARSRVIQITPIVPSSVIYNNKISAR